MINILDAIGATAAIVQQATSNNQRDSEANQMYNAWHSIILK